MSADSYEAIYEEYAPFVYNLAYRYTGNRAEAEDLTQEAMVRVFRFLDSFKGGAFRSWLYRIVTNLFLTRLRRERRLPRQSLERVLSNGEVLEEALPDRSEDPAEIVEQTGIQDHVQSALGALPENYRTALVLRDVEGLTPEEIAAALDIPIGTVRSRISRGRDLFKTELSRSQKAGNN